MGRSKHMLMLVVVAVAGCGRSSTSTNTQGPKLVEPARPMIEGVWLVESAEMGGQAMPAEFVKTTTLTISGDQYVVMVGNAPDRGTVRRDDTKSPKTMDIVGFEGPNKGKTFLAIYELVGDKLRVCYDLSGESRPTEFATKPGTKLFLATYGRK